MAMNDLAPIKKITPDNDAKIRGGFNYIQCGGTGDIAVSLEEGESVIITAAILDKMSIVPVGSMNRVLSTGTTATDIYAW